MLQHPQLHHHLTVRLLRHSMQVLEHLHQRLQRSLLNRLQILRRSTLKPLSLAYATPMKSEMSPLTSVSEVRKKATSPRSGCSVRYCDQSRA